MPSTIMPMTIGDIFDRTLRLIGKTFTRSAAISVSFLIIPVILLTISANHFYSSLPDFSAGATPDNITAIGPMFMGGFYLGIASLLFAFAALMAEIAISVVIGGEINMERIDYATAVKMTFGSRWLNGIGEGILKTLATMGVVIFASILGGIIAAAAGRGSAGSAGLLILFTVLFILIIVMALIYCLLRLYFALTAVAVQDLGPIEALKKSWFLVGGHWWRTLGILIVFFLLSGFAISVITVPVTFGSMWGEYKELFTALGQSGGHISPSQLRHFQTGLGHLIGIGSGLSSILSLLLTPAFTVVMYFDLRARHDEFHAESDPTTPEVPVTTL
jgi:hypothetical protein